MKRNDLIEKIQQAQHEIKTAGKIHRRDLGRHIKRMKRELMIYDRFHKESDALLDAKASTQSG